ncbi:MAG: hypothetical protein HETSPECPRED_003406 [Heterodermia speciosa]|uniref:Uncharacterized protein n=1 Tax=Heterodermia speciosa TaxID=116794 RepID=A0A8H3EC80_9LECA|nr:MAG: hypothetical protein HETSPECPRED_003406 [Heterodermia speciosa]
MVVARVSARWATQWPSWTAGPTRGTPRPWLSQKAIRRGYASQGPHHGARKSDLPWAIGSAVVTIPSVAYLIQPQLKKASDDGHGHGHGAEHGSDDKGGHVEDTEPGELVPNLRKKETGDEDAGDDQASSQDAGESKSEAASDDSDSENDGEKQDDTPDSSDGEESQNTAHETDSGQNVEGVQFKGPTSGGTAEGEQGDTRKHIPDAKGGNKKRIESHYAKRLGEAASDDPEADDEDKAASAKSPGDISTSQSGKQEGLSNSDTKHSTDIANNPDKSKKAEGAPETAKLKGTVAPDRPQVGIQHLDDVSITLLTLT